MWPQGGSETSPTSSAAAGQPRWVPWTEMNGTWPSQVSGCNGQMEGQRVDRY